MLRTAKVLALLGALAFPAAAPAFDVDFNPHTMEALPK